MLEMSVVAKGCRGDVARNVQCAALQQMLLTIMYSGGSANISVGFSAVTTKAKNDFALPRN